jgi:hypothetical protein
MAHDSSSTPNGLPGIAARTSSFGTADATAMLATARVTNPNRDPCVPHSRPQNEHEIADTYSVTVRG